MTNFYTEERLFENWYYVRDPTHVVFYCKETIEYIAKIFNWKIEISDKWFCDFAICCFPK